jgi:hypothetical protein
MLEVVQSAGKAMGDAPDVVVVGAIPELKDDRPQAAVVLPKGKQFSTASEPLD